MTEFKQYRCVNCGKPTKALFKTYGPSVLKLSKCEKCKGVVDKYIEYDKVIVMIDAVLISKEAQRHIIYNIDFKSYWKLFIILMLLETYGIWRNDSLLNIIINTICGIHTNSTMNSTYLNIPMNLSQIEWWHNQCRGWIFEYKGDDNDLFIWEKDFYIQFLSTFAGIISFVGTVHLILNANMPVRASRNQVTITRVLKAFSLANVSILFTLPMLVWGNTDTSAETRTIHYTLVLAYSYVVFYSVFTVLYDTPTIVTLVTLLASHTAKYLTTFLITPFLRTLVT